MFLEPLTRIVGQQMCLMWEKGALEENGYEAECMSVGTVYQHQHSHHAGSYHAKLLASWRDYPKRISCSNQPVARDMAGDAVVARRCCQNLSILELLRVLQG